MSPRPPAPPALVLRHVKAAQLRARLARKAIGQLALATLFLMGALSFGYGPQRRDGNAALWMAFLCILSTVHMATGTRLLTRAKRWPPYVGNVATVVWGASLLALLWGLGRA